MGPPPFLQFRVDGLMPCRSKRKLDLCERWDLSPGWFRFGRCDSPPNNEERRLSRIENHIVIGMADEDPLEEHSWQQTVFGPGRHVLRNAHRCHE